MCRPGRGLSADKRSCIVCFQITTSYLDDEISFMARGCKSNKPCPDDGTEECMIFGQNKVDWSLYIWENSSYLRWVPRI
ncbi:hypothetical protein LSH36_468g04084 [Paralvinella palmiformis]|uniref:Uncharacterized protein n=1 Tax=Paralvinella palmiformis TaxID=53620 RepID=A0AAD9JAE0_9ANNE|nr:hypothetical protein LSH36_468g04084 [Paralvinella palmiformis]